MTDDFQFPTLYYVFQVLYLSGMLLAVFCLMLVPALLVYRWSKQKVVWTRYVLAGVTVIAMSLAISLYVGFSPQSSAENFQRAD